MVRIGIIGGMSPQSSSHYGIDIHNGVQKALGGHHSANLVQIDVDFAYIRDLMLQEKWEEIGEHLADIAAQIVNYNDADKVAVASNTIHKVAPQIIERIGEKHFLHIADCTAEQCLAKLAALVKMDPATSVNGKRFLLLGTLPTTSQREIVIDRLEQHGLKIVVPSHEHRETLDDIIFNQLCRGQIEDDTTSWYLSMIGETIELYDGVAGVILGCTELSMLFGPTTLSHHPVLRKRNHNLPFVAADSVQAHVNSLVKTYLQLNHLT